MNLVGKIFTVLVLVMSLVFMGMAMSVYSTHKVWRDMVLNPQKTADKDLGLKFQLENIQKEKQRLEEEKSKLENDLASEKTAQRRVLTQLEQERNQVREENKQLVEDHAKVVESERKTVAALQSTQEVAKGLRERVDNLVKDVNTARDERDAKLKDVLQKTDELHQAVNEVKRLKERGNELAELRAKYEGLLKQAGIDPSKDYSPKPPRGLAGTIKAVRANDLVEVNIGADDGLAKGHQLMVYRADGSYLGQVEVIDVRPEMAVCRVDPSYRRGAIQEGDRVAAKF